MLIDPGIANLSGHLQKNEEKDDIIKQYQANFP